MTKLAATRDAERRQVTVLFCDLVGSTELANAIDPEDMGEFIRHFQDTCAGAIARFDGFVAKFMGDSVLAYFGYPLAHEDAVGQSVRAALAIVESIAHDKRPDGQPPEVRIGIATGLVVIGDLVGAGAAREHAVVGETPNLAARLQALAAPNAILVSQTTHQLLGRQFESESLGEHALKGFAKPMPAWRVLRESAAESRFAAIRTPGRHSLIGRMDEMELLLDRWQLTREGAGQVVVIQGEAGIGKSRVVDALTRLVADEPHVRVLCQCSPYHTNSALYPVIRHLERAAGFAGDDSTAQKLDKLEAIFAGPGGDIAATTSLMADLLSVPTGDRYPSLEIPPAQHKVATIAALVDQLTRLGDRQPVLFVLEDAHWVDPTTRELVTRLIDGTVGARVLVVVTGRMEFTSPWPSGGRIASCVLHQLGKEQCANLVTGIAAGRNLEPGLIDEIVAKADGIPLFVEELTKAVMESAASDRPVVPATLQDSLMARLDRLGPAKEIAQIAAVLGQRFSRPLLEMVAVESAANVAPGIARLVDAGMVVDKGRGTDGDYSFSHALMRDIAYENLLRGRRRQIHERAARALVEHFSAVTENEPELVAHHFAHAGISDLASTYHERAGDRAASRFAFAEAAAHFGAGQAETGKLADGPDRVQRELALLLKLGPALTLIKGAQSPEVESTYRIAHDAAERAGDKAALFKATWGLWYNANVGRNLERARDRAQELVALGQESPDSDLMLEAIHCRWSTAFFRGDVATALKDSGEGVRRYDAARHSWMGAVFGGHDPGVCAFQLNAQTLCFSGYTVQARRRMEEAVSLAERLGHPHSLGFALMNSVMLYSMLGERETVERVAQRLIELAEKYNFPPLVAHALLLSGWARAVGPESDAGLAMMEAAYPKAAAAGPTFRYYAALLASARLTAGRASQALEVCRWALDTVTEPGVGLMVPDLHRLQGASLLRLGAEHEAEAMQSLQTAIDFAKKQGAPLLQLRAALTMAEAAIARGRLAEGVELLRAACASLPPECDVPELAEAKRLLAA